MRWMPHILIITFQSTSIHLNPNTNGGFTLSTYNPLTIYFHTISIKCVLDQFRFNPHIIYFQMLIWTSLYKLYIGGKVLKKLQVRAGPAKGQKQGRDEKTQEHYVTTE